MRLKHSLVITTCIICLTSAVIQAAPADSLTAGKIIQIESAVLGETRPVYISTPRGYEQGTEKYQVIYLLDADYNFLFTAGIVRFLEAYDQIPKMIIVGIPNESTRTRARDMTYNKNKRVPGRYPLAGGADTFLDFFEQELCPYVDSHYRTRSFRLLIGHSLGGLFASYALTARPGLFNAYFSFSPSLWWNEFEMLDMMKLHITSYPETNAYFLTTIADEGEGAMPMLRDLTAELNTLGGEDFRARFKHFPDENHASTAIAATHYGLKDLYKNWTISWETNLAGLKAIQKHYADLSRHFGYDIPLTEDIAHHAACSALVGGKPDVCIEILLFNAARNPDAARTFAILAEAYEAKGDIEKAIEYCKQTLKRDPEYSKIKIMMERLKKI